MRFNTNMECSARLRTVVITASLSPHPLWGGVARREAGLKVLVASFPGQRYNRSWQLLWDGWSSWIIPMVELHAAGTVNVIGPVTLNQTVVSLGIILRGMACTPRHSMSLLRMGAADFGYCTCGSGAVIEYKCRGRSTFSFIQSWII